MLTRLIYASEAAETITPQVVQSIITQARSANAREHITGMLAFDNRWFLQALEGDRQAISQTFCRIALDKRHQRIVLMDVSPIDERVFNQWSMGFAAADAKGLEKFTRFSTSGLFEPPAMTAASALGLLLCRTGD